MSYTEKIDILDMLIKMFVEHEQKLDWLVNRIEVVADQLAPQNKAQKYEHDLKDYLDQRLQDNL